MTLIELVVVVAILGLLTGVISLRIDSEKRPKDSVPAEISRARDTAVLGGRRVVLFVEGDSGVEAILVLPDGRVLRERKIGR